MHKNCLTNLDILSRRELENYYLEIVTEINVRSQNLVKSQLSCNILHKHTINLTVNKR